MQRPLRQFRRWGNDTPLQGAGAAFFLRAALVTRFADRATHHRRAGTTQSNYSYGQNHITVLENILAFLSMQGVTLNLGGKPLLDSADFSVEVGDRLCLVGRNGAGKSSLLALLGGQMQPNSGMIIRPARS